MKFCRHCGSPLKYDDAKFCTQCGELVAPPAPAETPMEDAAEPAGELVFTVSADDREDLPADEAQDDAAAAGAFEESPAPAPDVGVEAFPVPTPDVEAEEAFPVPSPDDVGADAPAPVEPPVAEDPFPAEEERTADPFPAEGETLTFRITAPDAAPEPPVAAPQPPEADSAEPGGQPAAADSFPAQEAVGDPFPAEAEILPFSSEPGPVRFPDRPAEPAAGAPTPAVGEDAWPTQDFPLPRAAQPPRETPAEPEDERAYQAYLTGRDLEEEYAAVAQPPQPPAGMRPVQAPMPPRPPQGGPPPGSVPPPPKRKRKVPVIAVAVVLAVALVGGFFGLRAKTRADAGDLIDDFIVALATGDELAIQAMILDSGGAIHVSSLSGLARAGRDSAALAEITALLEAQLDGSYSGQSAPAVLLQRAGGLPLLSKYSIVIQETRIAVETDGDPEAAAAAFHYAVGGRELRAEITDDGLVIGDLCPGLYDVQGFYSRYGVTLAGSTEQLLVLDQGGGVYAPVYDAEEAVIRCEAADAVIQINGYDTDLSVSGGEVRVYPAVSGMEVIAHVHTEGRIDTARVRIVRGTANYEFVFDEQKVDVEQAPTTSEQQDVAYLLRDYFYSYLEAINLQDAAELRHCTDEQREYAAERVTGEANRDYTFQFQELWLDMDSFEFYSDGGDQAARVLVSLRYRYAERGEVQGAWEDGGNIQWCTLQLVDGEWLVSSTTINNNAELSGNLLAVG